MTKLARNERRKLTATFLNGVGIAIFAIGALAQIVPTLGQGEIEVPVLIIAASCIVLAGALHWVARFLLRGLEE